VGAELCKMSGVKSRPLSFESSLANGNSCTKKYL